MDEEERLMLERAVSGELLTTASTQGPMQELTPEMARSMPVVNRARQQNPISSVTSLLSNPEFQNMLFSFGRAFSRNDPNAPGTILAEAGQTALGQQANARALGAFESGGNISGAAGRFADPGLVAGLQGRRQEFALAEEELSLDTLQFEESQSQFQTQAELARDNLGLDERQFTEAVRQFDREQDLQTRLAGLRELGITNDYFLNQMRINIDEKNFNLRVQQLQDQKKLEERKLDIEEEWRQAQVEQEAGVQDRANMAQVGRLLETYGDLAENLQSQLETITNRNYNQEMSEADLSEYASLQEQLRDIRQEQSNLLTAQTEALSRSRTQQEGGGQEEEISPADLPIEELTPISDRGALGGLPAGVYNLNGTRVETQKYTDSSGRERTRIRPLD